MKSSKTDFDSSILRSLTSCDCKSSLFLSLDDATSDENVFRSIDEKEEKNKSIILPDSIKTKIDEILGEALGSYVPPIQLRTSLPLEGKIVSSNALSVSLQQLITETVQHIQRAMDRGKTETIFTLNMDAFPSSPLFGSTINITLEEYDTAPCFINVSLAANPQGIALIQRHLPHLMEAFGKHDQVFKVHRFETRLQTAERRTSKRYVDKMDNEHDTTTT